MWSLDAKESKNVRVDKGPAPRAGPIFQTIIEEVQVKHEPTVIDWLDDLELSHDRHMMLLQIDPEHLDDPPPLLIEEYDSSQELDDLSPGGNIRLYPEDLPRLIAWLEKWLQAYRECAEEDGSKTWDLPDSSVGSST